MKKLLLFLSFLASQLLAIECTEEQYKPIFDKNSDRYMHSHYQSYDKSHVVIDKKSIVYDKANQKIKCWIISQSIDNLKYGSLKVLWEFNLKNNQARILDGMGYSCNGEPMDKAYKDDWDNIIPNSGNESALNSLKEYLNIK